VRRSRKPCSDRLPFYSRIVVAIRPTAATPFTIAVTHPTTFRRRPLVRWPIALVIVAATPVGMAINYLGINAITALVLSAVLNGIIAVPLVFLVMIVCLRRSGLREVDPTGTYLT